MVTRVPRPDQAGAADPGSDSVSLPANGVDLAGLVGEASALDNAPSPLQLQQQQQADQAQQAGAAELAGQVAGNLELIEFGFACVAPFAPERYTAPYGPQQRHTIAEAFTRLAIKRGWDLAAIGEKFGAELALLAAVAMPIVPILMAEVKAKRDAAAAGEHKQQQQEQEQKS